MAYELCCIGRGLAAIRHKSGSKSYTYYMLNAMKTDLDQFEAEGTVFGSITKKDLAALRCIVPPDPFIEEFERMVGPLDQLIAANVMQAWTLIGIRDALLPKLLSGEIRVKQAEKIVGEAV